MDFEFQEEGTLAKVLKDSGEKDVAVGSVCSLIPLLPTYLPTTAKALHTKYRC
jgi:pyruvate/2-oxoglutarate dehydrogenase complex dihydrolipoamide acyltransferase (E2) component